MKFELDHRTGMMRPKKDEEIYFAQSQGGGLIVDDKKNNIKYIIERDGRITKLFGSFDKNNLNFYDMRDARIIADRVMRLLGRGHKYSDFHYFLRGYRMSESFIKTCSDFLSESIWSDIQDRSTGDTVRAEDKNVVGVLEDGTKLRVPMDVINGAGKLIIFDDGKKYYTLYDGFYIAVVNEGRNDIYYVYDPDAEDDVNMVIGPRFIDDSFRTKYKFADLRAVLMSADENNDGIDPLDLCDLTVKESYNNAVDINFGDESFDYLVFVDYDDAVKDAIESERELLDDIGIDTKTVNHWRNILGDDIFNEGELKDLFDEDYGSYYDDLDEEDAIDELLRWEVIEDTDEYFDLDEDGVVDHTLPKFDYQDYRDKYVEKRLDSIDDFVDEYISNFGDEDIKNYIDLDKVAEKAVELDGPGHSISSYDGTEREVSIDDVTYYIYRRQ